MTLRGRMLAILSSAALCGAWMTGDTHASLAAALLIAPLVVDRLWRGRGLPPIQILVAPRRSQAGSLFLETLHLRNPAGRRAAYDLRIVEPRTSTRSGSAFIGVLEPGQSVSFRIPARLWRRGHHVERAFVLESCYPLGLVRNQMALVCTTDLIAEPARLHLPANLLPAPSDSQAEPAPRDGRGGVEFFALREYRYGEDARRVHALRSAATATLIRAETRGEQERDTCLVLDLRRPPGHAARRTDRHFEWSLSAAATLIDDFAQAGTLRCFVLGETARRFALATPADADELLALLAEVRPSLHGALPDRTREEIAGHRTCLWIPSGGFPAHHERRGLRCVMVTPGAHR